MIHSLSKQIFLLFMGMSLLILTISCSSTTPAPATPAPPTTLEPITEADVQTMAWKDDLNFEALPAAIEQSMRYYQRVQDQQKFEYGTHVYTAQEMLASMRLFLNIIQTYEGEQRYSEIKKKFLFFESKNGDGNAFFTGYYEPVLKGSLTPRDDLTAPVYGVPDDLVTLDLGAFQEDLKGRKITGRVYEKTFIPYDARNDIANKNSLAGRAKVIAYVNEIELFFLQIQGSGLITLADGSVLRVNYAHQNGRPYRAIGARLLNKIPREKMSMDTLKKYLYEHPGEVSAILNYNPSYTFFRQVEDGPLGNIEVPLTPGRSLAMDRGLLPRGGLAFIETAYPLTRAELEAWEASLPKPVVDKSGQIMQPETPQREMPPLKPLTRFMLVQDTGGAIRGHGRADIFWGSGEEAAWNAGNMKQPGRIFVLVARKEFLAAKPAIAYSP